jgi:hypothetical protein
MRWCERCFETNANGAEPGGGGPERRAGWAGLAKKPGKSWAWTGAVGI